MTYLRGMELPTSQPSTWHKDMVVSKANVESVDKDGKTALHRAAQNGHAEIVRILLEAKAKMEATNGDGRTPLHWAAYWGSTEIVKVLLDAKANLEVR